MKKIIFCIALGALFVTQALVANPKVFKDHRGLKGKDDASMNCGYCHSKAGIQKKKGQDLEALKKGEYCSFKDCHK